MRFHLIACAALLAATPVAAQSQPSAAASDPRMGAPRGTPLSGSALDARTEEIGSLLRCPVCQGLSVADSPSSMARNMKAEVRDQLAAGYDREQILEHFERSYGEFVRLEPQMHGVNVLVWLGPFAVLAGGAAIVILLLRRSRGGTTRAQTADRAGTAPARDALPDDPRLAGAVRRVRELAYGWPGGVPPRTPAASS